MAVQFARQGQCAVTAQVGMQQSDLSRIGIGGDAQQVHDAGADGAGCIDEQPHRLGQIQRHADQDNGRTHAAHGEQHGKEQHQQK